MRTKATGTNGKHDDRQMKIFVKREAEDGDDPVEDFEKPIKKSVSKGGTTKGPNKKNPRRSSTKKPATSSTTTTGAPPASSTASPASSDSSTTAKPSAGRSLDSTASSTTKGPSKSDATSTSKPSGKPDSTSEPSKPPKGKEELVALNYALAGTKAWFSALMKQNWHTMHAAKAHELLALKNIISKNLKASERRPSPRDRATGGSRGNYAHKGERALSWADLS